MARYARGVMGVLFALGVSNSVSLLLRVLIARLGVVEVGVFYLVDYVLKFVVLVALLGTGSYIVREVSGDEQKTSDILSYAYTLTMLASVSCAFLLFWFSESFATYFHEPLLSLPLKIIAIAIPCAVLYQNALFFARSKMLAKSYVLLQVSFEVTRFLAILAVFLFLPTLNYILVAQTGAILLFGVVSFLLVKPYLQGPTLRGPKTYIAFLFGAALAFAMLDWVDSFMLGRMVSVYAVGLYDTAFVLASILTFFPTAASTFLLPRLMKGDRKIGVRVMEWIALVNGALCLLLVLFAAPLLSLFGSAFVEAVPILYVLAAGFYLGYGLIAFRTFLYMGNRQRLICILSFIAVLMDGALNYLLIPWWGALGAAYATSITLAVLGVGYAWYAKPYVPSYSRKLLVSVLALLVSLVGGSVSSVLGIIAYPAIHLLSPSWRKELRSIMSF